MGIVEGITGAPIGVALGAAAALGTGNLKVDTAALQATATEVTTHTNELSNQFNELQSTVSATAYYWIGEAGDQYRKEFAARKDEMDTILTTLREYPKDLLEQAGIYEKAETTNTESSAPLQGDYI